MSRPRILMVLSSSPQGWYLPEFAHPYEVLSPKCDLIVASPQGGPTVLDPISVELFKDDDICTEFKNTKQSLWMNTAKLEEFIGKANEFASIFYVGGFGPMFDLVDNPISIQLIREFHDAGKNTTFLCHGTAAALKVRLADGSLLVQGKSVTGFSNQEEIDVDRQKDMPFHLETALNNASGGHYEKAGKAWDAHITVDSDGKLLFGQNPASASSLAKELLKVLVG
ncbi:hypothetical protein D0Z07_1514 [Hyphodiscus hymeniophilus]|uniref:D-lactate dehydratase n=1 Tax=Hyphodiscus hymeniophilus TaxID=353542 RepID=A0A9P6VQ21_9HELO|nr:hypothetical protein D0Z07_1514 [Hyphodiscus hymeniophilus]